MVWSWAKIKIIKWLVDPNTVNVFVFDEFFKY